MIVFGCQGDDSQQRAPVVGCSPPRHTQTDKHSDRQTDRQTAS